MQMVIRVADGMTLDDVRTVSGEFGKNDQIHHAGDVPQLLERLVEHTTRIPGARDAWREALDTYDARATLIQTLRIGTATPRPEGLSIGRRLIEAPVPPSAGG